MTVVVTDRLFGERSSVAIKAPCVAAATTNIVLSGLQTINGYTTHSGDRILVTAQADSTTNGIYDASTTAWTRSGDFDGANDVAQGTLVVVPQNATGIFYQLTTVAPVIGTSVLNFVQFWPPSISYPQTSAEQAAGVTPVNTTYQQGDVRRYGADPSGATDSSAAFQSAFKVKGLITALGSFLLNTGQSMDISTTTLVGPCQITSGLAANAGALLTIIASAGPESNSRNTINGIEFIGTNLIGVQAIAFNTASNADNVFGVENCSFYRFGCAAYIANNAYEIEFHRCAFSSCGGDSAALYSHFVSSERVSAVQCAFFNCSECVRIDNGGEVFLTNCSLDYSTRVFNVFNAGVLNATGCYIESNTDADYWFKTGAAADVTIMIDHCMIVQTGIKVAFAIGQSLSNSGSGIIIKNSHIYSSTNTVVYPLIAGPGAAFGSGNSIDGFANNGYAWPQFSFAAELCSNNGFANGTGGTAGWTLSNSGAGGTPTQSTVAVMTASAAGSVMTVSSVSSGSLHVGDVITGTGVPPNTCITSLGTGAGGTGTYNVSTLAGFASTTISVFALAITTSSAGFFQTASWSINASPGDLVGASIYVSSNSAAATFTLEFVAYGGDGTILAGSAAVPGYNYFNGSSYPAPTAYQLASCFYPLLPPGTATVRLLLQGDQVSAHTTFVKNVHLTKY